MLKTINRLSATKATKIMWQKIVWQKIVFLFKLRYEHSDYHWKRLIYYCPKKYLCCSFSFQILLRNLVHKSVWECLTNITAKYVLSRYVIRTVVFLLPKNYETVFFLNNTWLLFLLLDKISHKQKYNTTKQAMMVLASTIPLIWKTRSLSIVKKIILFLIYVVLDHLLQLWTRHLL